MSKVKDVECGNMYHSSINIILPQYVNYWGKNSKKSQRAARRVRGRLSRAPAACGAPRLNVALARLVDLKAALLAETRARGPDGSRTRSPQLARCHARCSRDQLRRRMGQHGAALARGRGRAGEVVRAPPSLGRQLEARQRRAAGADESRAPPRSRWPTHYSPRALSR